MGTSISAVAPSASKRNAISPVRFLSADETHQSPRRDVGISQIRSRFGAVESVSSRWLPISRAASESSGSRGSGRSIENVRRSSKSNERSPEPALRCFTIKDMLFSPTTNGLDSPSKNLGGVWRYPQSYHPNTHEFRAIDAFAKDQHVVYPHRDSIVKEDPQAPKITESAREMRRRK